MKLKLNHTDVFNLAAPVVQKLIHIQGKMRRVIKCYPVPRGGVPVAYVINSFMHINIVNDPVDADFILDDLVDSGATRDALVKQYPDTPFFALIDKQKMPEYNKWIIFPWEGNAESSIEDNIARILQYIGEDVGREGLQETPKRVAKAWEFWAKGYEQKPEDVLKVFEDGGEGYNEMVIVKNIPFYSHCEHHLAPFFGVATIGYIPNGKIVGLSKLSRLLDIYGRRLQVQERLTCQVADAIEAHLNPIGVGVVIKARHMCCESRGISQQGHHTVTSALRGILRTDNTARAEFLNLCNSVDTL